MPQSLAETYFHIVFSTKDRVPFLRDRALRKDDHDRRLLKEHNAEYDERYVWD